MNDTLSGHGEVLVSQLLLIEYHIQVVGSVHLRRERGTIAVEELDRSGVAVLGKEADGLLSRLNFNEHVVNRRALADEVGLASH